MVFAPTARHLLARQGSGRRPLRRPADVDDLAAAAGLSRAHFSREFRRAFGESPHAYLLTRRLERAAALLRSTDHSVAEICFSVGLQSLGSFTTSFTRTYGVSPTAYRAAFPPAAAPGPRPELRHCASTAARNAARLEKTGRPPATSVRGPRQFPHPRRSR